MGEPSWNGSHTLSTSVRFWFYSPNRFASTHHLLTFVGGADCQGEHFSRGLEPIHRIGDVPAEWARLGNDGNHQLSSRPESLTNPSRHDESHASCCPGVFGKQVMCVAGHICNASKFIQVSVCQQHGCVFNLLAQVPSPAPAPPLSFVHNHACTGFGSLFGVLKAARTARGQRVGCSFIPISRLGSKSRAPITPPSTLVLEVRVAGGKEVASEMWLIPRSGRLRRA